MSDFAMSNGILSPTPSTTSIANFSSPRLPSARLHPLRPGSSKEIALINYLDDKVLHITRRYAKKSSNERTDNDDTPGYGDFEEVMADVDAVLDVVWISGTPAVQIPYLLSLAGLLCSYMSAFPISALMFPVLSKLDEGFARLLRSSAVPTVTMTEKDRIKSLIEETRVAAVELGQTQGLGSEWDALNEEEDNDNESEEGIDTADDSYDRDDPSPVSMRIAKIYKQTLSILGDSLV